jgi:fibronectin-binding autotransporter adhesin
VTISNGTVRAGADSALGTGGSAYVLVGTALDIGGARLGEKQIIVAGDGVDGVGANGIQAGLKMSPGGLVDIQAGTVRNNYVRNSWVNNRASVNVAAGAMLDIYSEHVQLDALTGDGTVQNGYAPNGMKTLTVGVAGGGGLFAGPILGGGGDVALVKTGAGTQARGADREAVRATGQLKSREMAS